jgi:hypothetical protein
VQELVGRQSVGNPKCSEFENLLGSTQKTLGIDDHLAGVGLGEYRASEV